MIFFLSIGMSCALFRMNTSKISGFFFHLNRFEQFAGSGFSTCADLSSSFSSIACYLGFFTPKKNVCGANEPSLADILSSRCLCISRFIVNL